jgi:hypothetical protein
MSDLNKPIVVRTQNLLKELGYDVKTSHVYQLLSRLAGEKSWQIAKAKNTDFKQVITKIDKELPVAITTLSFESTISQLSQSTQDIVFTLGSGDWIQQWLKNNKVEQICPVNIDRDGCTEILKTIFFEMRNRLIDLSLFHSIERYEKATGNKRSRIILIMERVYPIFDQDSNFSQKDKMIQKTALFQLNRIKQFSKKTGISIVIGPSKFIAASENEVKILNNQFIKIKTTEDGKPYIMVAEIKIGENELNWDSIISPDLELLNSVNDFPDHASFYNS